MGVGGRGVTSLGGGHILLGGNIPGFPDKTLHGLAKLSIMQSYLVMKKRPA